MTTEELLNLSPEQLNRMGIKELKRVVSQMSSTANKRLARLENTRGGTNSPAYQQATARPYTGRTGGKFGVADKNLNQLRNEYKAVKNFLGKKTSSVTGFKSYRAKVYKDIGGEIEDEETERKFWKLYRKYEETNGGIGSTYDSKSAKRDLRKIMVDNNYSHILKHMNDKYAKFDLQENEYMNDKEEIITFNPKNEDDILKLMIDYSESKYME